MVGIIGGGQLARMCQPPAIALGVSLSVLAEAVDSSAALVVPSSPVGSHADTAAVLDFARHCDVVTFDHEHVPGPVLAALATAGVVLHPTPEALLFAQDKLAMRRRLSAIGIRCPRWSAVGTTSELQQFGDRVGWPVMLKTPRGGYDGKGLRVVGDPGQAEDWFELVDRDRTGGSADRAALFADGLLAEEMVTFTRELAVLVARSPSGQAAAWPVVETVQSDGICTEVLAPAPGLDLGYGAMVTEAALRIAGELQVTGVLAVEMFEVADAGGERGYLVNELAMRPHNSGHWTIDGAVTSQFEQHLRAVLDLPLGDPRPRSAWSVMGNVLGGDYPQLYPAFRHLMARDPGLKLHLYGKDVRPGRKIGHVTVSGDDVTELRSRARHATDYLQGVVIE